MTYIIDQYVKKIKAPIICKFDGQEVSFENGEKLAERVFNKFCLIDSVQIKDEKAVLIMTERKKSSINSGGEEMFPGEDWIREHKERFGTKTESLRRSINRSHG